jgi:hypothetical protein
MLVAAKPDAWLALLLCAKTGVHRLAAKTKTGIRLFMNGVQSVGQRLKQAITVTLVSQDWVDSHGARIIFWR